MLQQESTAWGVAGATDAVADAGVSMLAYRSRAVHPPSQRDLDRILRDAQQRNRTHGLTGLLIYDQGCFFQWLEGPQPALTRTWEAIRRDVRHADVEMLRQQSIPKRFFAAWDMRLARRARGKLDETLVAVEAPGDLLRKLRAQPAVMSDGAWDDVFADVVVPRLAVAHPLDRSVALPRVANPAIWHAEREAGAELAVSSMGLDAGKTSLYLDHLVAQGAGVEALFNEVFEPAARFLGGMWDEDRRSELEITMGLVRLQIEVRRLRPTFATHAMAMQQGHAVLVAPQPGEPHGLGAAMASDLFERGGWDVSCEFPSSDRVLRELVHERWFDVLDLSLSCALRRDQQLQSMGVTIRAAQAASLNPALVVIVDGRAFFDDPAAFASVGADAGSMTVVGLVPTAQRLLDALTPGPNPAVGAIGLAASGSQTPSAAAASMRLFERRFRSTVF